MEKKKQIARIFLQIFFLSLNINEENGINTI